MLFRVLVSGSIGSIFLFQIVNSVFVSGGVVTSAHAIVTNFHAVSGFYFPMYPPVFQPAIIFSGPLVV